MAALKASLEGGEQQRKPAARSERKAGAEKPAAKKKPARKKAAG